MDRTEMLDHLKSARRAHVKWLQSAGTLISGRSIEKNEVPVEYTACNFGRWLYSDGQKLAKLDGIDYLEDITKKHQELHEEYRKIYNIYFGQDNRSFLGKLFNSKPKIYYSDQQLAQKHYQKLRDISGDLLSLIELLEKRIGLLPRAVFDAIN